METISRDVRDINGDERLVLERVIGRPLQEDQKIIIQVVAAEGRSAMEAAVQPEKLPEWCNVFEGLTGEQLAKVEEAILRRSDLTRPS